MMITSVGCVEINEFNSSYLSQLEVVEYTGHVVSRQCTRWEWIIGDWNVLAVARISFGHNSQYAIWMLLFCSVCSILCILMF